MPCFKSSPSSLLPFELLSTHAKPESVHTLFSCSVGVDVDGVLSPLLPSLLSWSLFASLSSGLIIIVCSSLFCKVLVTVFANCGIIVSPITAPLLSIVLSSSCPAKEFTIALIVIMLFSFILKLNGRANLIPNFPVSEFGSSLFALSNSSFS